MRLPLLRRTFLFLPILSGLALALVACGRDDTSTPPSPWHRQQDEGTQPETPPPLVTELRAVEPECHAKGVLVRVGQATMRIGVTRLRGFDVTEAGMHLLLHSPSTVTGADARCKWTLRTVDPTTGATTTELSFDDSCSRPKIKEGLAVVDGVAYSRGDFQKVVRLDPTGPVEVGELAGSKHLDGVDHRLVTAVQGQDKRVTVLGRAFADATAAAEEVAHVRFPVWDSYAGLEVDGDHAWAHRYAFEGGMTNKLALMRLDTDEVCTFETERLDGMYGMVVSDFAAYHDHVYVPLVHEEGSDGLRIEVVELALLRPGGAD